MKALYYDLVMEIAWRSEALQRAYNDLNTATIEADISERLAMKSRQDFEVVSVNLASEFAAHTISLKQAQALRIEIGNLRVERDTHRREFESERGRCNALVNRNAALEREIETLRGQICDINKVRADRDRYDRKLDSIEGAESLLRDTPWWHWPTVEILDASNDQVVKVVKAPKVEAPKVRYIVERGHVAPFDYVLAPVATNKGAEVTDTPAKAYRFAARSDAQRYCDERTRAMGLSADFYRVIEVA